MEKEKPPEIRTEHDMVEVDKRANELALELIKVFSKVTDKLIIGRTVGEVIMTLTYGFSSATISALKSLTIWNDETMTKEEREELVYMCKREMMHGLTVAENVYRLGQPTLDTDAVDTLIVEDGVATMIVKGPTSAQ